MNLRDGGLRHGKAVTYDAYKSTNWGPEKHFLVPDDGIVRCVSGTPLPYRVKAKPKIHRVGHWYSDPKLDWYQYFVQHLATARTFIHEQQFASHGEFLKAMANWNKDPRWKYTEARIH